ncbi:hypothetical protein VB834_06270 [Limnoraphis robusta Tam1]|uniref:Type I restriction enzyme R protein N-terminal domain-containing protein n=1 Tax=Limnoraphis robusta CCNP1315 TaxID=3110306 RepID=A0ABU5U504_9CYAN|nr:hypothetical protein [Limnoraphis robusta]MEA5501410.1 hypothetical protein [Limnoraphis robusta BA-68 BA1]MEA5522278.1 hypothetical protein [Limnoraphis robusta CCNP1315]MEA5538635.1 hypothetical protein [Limnoraphis robusta Tam1]MEA5549309.1 hypothetical protein [Limnoraphis robusta CCNP1324]
MSFDSYKNISEVLQEFQITAIEAEFIIESKIEVRSVFQEDLEFCLREFSFEESEYAVCEMIIFPILKELYRRYRNEFTLWSHKAIIYDEKLSGTPDYILAQRSTLGKQVFEKPYFLVVEAKKDDFIKGWGQCLAEMVAMQKINNQPSQTLFGVVSNGKIWEFGKLNDNLFTKETRYYTISNIEKLLSALDYIFYQCQQEQI